MTKLLKRKLLIVLACISFAFVFAGFLFTGPVMKASADVATIALDDGAYVRVEDGKTSGLKFVARVNKTYFDTLRTNNPEATISAGMIIVPDDYVAAAGGYTFNELAGLNKSIAAQEVEYFVGVGDEYEYYGTLTNILAKNFTRKFSAYAYIKSSVELEGFTEYNDNWYLYADNVSCQSKTIYDVARIGYEANARYRVSALKQYLDGVAVIGYMDGVPTIINNTRYYTSPYTITPSTCENVDFNVSDEHNNYILNAGATGNLKCIVYNGVRKAVSTITDGDVKINVMTNQNATVSNGEGGAAVSLASKKVTNYGTTSISTMGGKGGNDYVAFKGSYGLNTYVSMTYTGNNMPTVCFFANDINADMTNTTEGNKGLIAISGMYASGAEVDGGTVTESSSLQYIKFYGPNRIDNNLHNALPNSRYLYDGTANDGTPAAIPLLTQNGVSTTAGADKYEYRYTVGIEEEYSATLGGNVLVFRLKLERKIDGVYNNVYDVTRKLAGAQANKIMSGGAGRGDAVTAEAVTAGNIIIYAQSKDSGTNDFTVSAPFTGVAIKTSQATSNADGSLTIKAKTAGGNSASSAGQWARYMNYLSYTGNYGVGYYVDTVFTGYMPQFIFFAKTEESDTYGYASISTLGSGNNSGSDTDYNRQGVVILNGLRTSRQYLQAFGPKRMSGTNAYGSTGQGELFSVKYGDEGGAYDLFTRWSVIADSSNFTTTYCLTIGTFIGSDGKVWIDMILKNEAQTETLSHLQKSLGLTEAEVGTGDIIILAPIGTDSTTVGGSAYLSDGKAIKFDYIGTPYKANPVSVKSSGATANSDGSLTIKAATAGSLNANGAGAWARYMNYYAYTDNYGVGYYVDAVFTGYMPQFIFFADVSDTDTYGYASISTLGNGNNQNSQTNYHRKGVVLLNGLQSQGNYIQAFGPDRMSGTNAYGSTGQGELFTVAYGDEDGAYDALTRTWQREHVSTTYFLSVGTFIGSDGKVWIDMILRDNTTGAEVSRLQRSLGLTEAQVGTGDILILAPIGVDNTQVNSANYLANGQSITFGYVSKPYLKVEQESELLVSAYRGPGYLGGIAFASVENFEDFKDVGMNVALLQLNASLGEESVYDSTAWEGSAAQTAMQNAYEAGIDKIIVTDNALRAAVKEGTDLVGEGCKFKTQSDLDAYIYNRLVRYCYQDGFYGVCLNDEPVITYTANLGVVYKAIKRVAANHGIEVYVHLNLLPANPKEPWMIGMQDGTERFEETDRETAYRGYIQGIIDATKADRLSVDIYPFMETYFKSGYYSMLQIFSEVCASNGVKTSLCVQSFGINGYRNMTYGQQVYYQLNNALAFGFDNIYFYTYFDSSEDGITGSAFINKDDSKTVCYNTTQTVLPGYYELAAVLNGYTYSGSKLVNYSAYAGTYLEQWFKFDPANQASLEFDNTYTFKKISSAETDDDIMLITELEKDGSYIYAIQNAMDKYYVDNGSEDGTLTATITLSSDCVGVYEYRVNTSNGELRMRYVPVYGTTYTKNLSAGEAVFIVPIM